MEKFWNSKKEENLEQPSTPASKITKTNKLKTIGLAALSAIGGVNADAQTSSSEMTHPEKNKTHNEWITTNDISGYKNITQNSKPITEGVRYTDIQNGDTIVNNILAPEVGDPVVFHEGYFKEPTTSIDIKNPDLKITQTRKLVDGSFEQDFEAVRKKGDTIRYTKITPPPSAPRQNAPKDLGVVNSDIPVIKETSLFATGKIKRPRIIIETAPRVSKEGVRGFGGRAPVPSMDIGEESVPEKQAEIFHSGIGPDLEEMTGNSHTFVQSNTMRFYRWVEDAKNWRRMDLRTWQKVQEKFIFLERKMNEVQSWENGGGPHDQFDFRTDSNFLFVKKMMAENPATLDDAMEKWRAEREGENTYSAR